MLVIALHLDIITVDTADASNKIARNTIHARILGISDDLSQPGAEPLATT